MWMMLFKYGLLLTAAVVVAVASSRRAETVNAYYYASEMCALCNDEPNSRMNPDKKLKCGHTVHKQCWDDVFELGQRRCPVCRKCAI